MATKPTDFGRMIETARPRAADEIRQLQDSLQSILDSMETDPLAAVTAVRGMMDRSRLVTALVIANARDDFSMQEIGERLGISRQGAAAILERHGGLPGDRGVDQARGLAL